MLLRARIVLPISQPPIEDGAVAISAGRVTAIGRWRDVSGGDNEVMDLGESVLLPGLVNAHCHLDYTHLAGQIAPTREFPDWIKSIMALKSQWGYSEFADSWLRGAWMLARTGTTTVADIEAVPELLPEVWNTTPLRVFSFLELTGVKSRRPPRDVVEEAARLIESLPAARGGAGLSPHAPYSTTPDLLRHAARQARQQQWRVTTHVAESQAEFDMFMYRRGPLHDWLKSQRDMRDCGLGSPVQHLDRAGLLGENFLAVHANYLWDHDARLLAERGASVVHCPRSHAYFGHQRFPLEQFTAEGVNLCLGTDSLASVNQVRRQPLELSLFAEMRALAGKASGLAPETILRMATVNGARALGLSGQAGELSAGSFADAIAVPFAGAVNDAAEAVVNHAGYVGAAMIGGQWVVPPHWQGPCDAAT